MKSLGRRASRGAHWMCALYVACWVCLLGMAGSAGRAWGYERRGIERASDRQTEQRPGINVELTQYVDEDGRELDAALSDIASLGVYWLRQRFPWQTIEPEPGVYDWERWDILVEAVGRHDLGLIAVLDAPPGWALSQGGYPLPCAPPCRVDAYARFVSAFARRYGQVIDHYQVWDEPNLSRSWGEGHVHPCGYVSLLRAAYPVLHAADSTASVLGGGLAPTQAPGPDNLNDLTYLRHMYALGGGDYMDILAVKPYGFWSGPEDRRVASDVLNYSRVVALREVQRDFGDKSQPIWAVEWGWGVLPGDWASKRAPWGSDSILIQAPRISDAVARARLEWPWMGVMCWADYQPDVPDDDPRWGFALRDGTGTTTALYPVLREALIAGSRGTLEREAKGLGPMEGRHNVMFGAIALSRWLLVALYLVAALILFVLWRRCACGRVVRRSWRWWSALPWFVHAGALLVLSVLYAVTPRPEWIAIELILAALILYNHPRWATIGAVFCIPFVYMVKRIEVGTGVLDILPAEIALWLAVVTAAARRLRTSRESVAWWPSRNEVRCLALDALWGAWVTLGALSPLVAPDPALAWREWRLTMLDPLLLYFLLRTSRLLGSSFWRSKRVCDPRSGGANPLGAQNRDPQSYDDSRVTATYQSADTGESRTCFEPSGRQFLNSLQTCGASVLVAWLASGIVVSLVAIGQWSAGAIVQAGDVGRVTGVYYSPNHLALYLERVWPFVLVLALYGGLARRWRLAAWAGVALISLALYFTYSRAAWLLAMPLALLVIGLAYRRQLHLWAAGAVVVVTLLAAASVLLGRSMPQAMPLTSTLFSEVRIPVWQSTVEMIADHPWTGVGLDGFRFVYPLYMRVNAWTEPLLYHPHNMWLDAAARLGLPGLIVFGLLIAGTVREIGRAAIDLDTNQSQFALRRAVIVGCLAGVWAGLAHGLVDSGYFVIDLAWSLALVSGLLAGSSE